MELSREQIKEGNDKLAKFIGWYQNTDGTLDEVWWENSEFAKYVAYSIHNNYPHRDLPFHRDWNYLMKVIDKIGSLYYHRDDDAPDWNWKDHYSYGELFHTLFMAWLRIDKHRKEFNLMNDLTSIWSGCVAWVDWYNSEDNQKDE
jgi:hypothetical protein